MNNMVKNTWKIIGIISIGIAILEFLAIIIIFNSSFKYIERENECAYEICDMEESDTYEAYLYDDYEQMCYCYIDGEIVKTKYIS